jgi:uncharacterized MAPEG superfamily protein
MMQLIQAGAGELRKAWVLPGVSRTILIGLVGVAAAVSFAVLQEQRFAELGRSEETAGLHGTDWSLLILNIAQIVPILLGAWVFGQDNGVGPRRRLLLTTPRRGRVWTAKMFVVLVLAFFSAVVCIAAALAPPLLLSNGSPSPGDLWSQLLWLMLYWLFVALLSASVSVIFRSMVGAVVPLLVWVLGLSDILQAQVPALGWAFDQVFKSAYLGGVVPSAGQLGAVAVQGAIAAAAALVVLVRRDTN